MAVLKIRPVQEMTSDSENQIVESEKTRTSSPDALAALEDLPLADWQRLKEDRSYGAAILRRLGTDLDMDEMLRASRILARKAAAPTYEDSLAHGRRDLIERIEDLAWRGFSWLSSRPRAVADCLLAMTPAEQERYRQDASFKSRLDAVVAQSVEPGPLREAVFHLLEKVARGEKPAPDLIFKLYMSREDSDGLTIISDLASSLVSDPVLAGKLREPSSADERQLRVRLIAAVGEALQDDGLAGLAIEIIDRGAIPADTALKIVRRFADGSQETSLLSALKSLVVADEIPVFSWICSQHDMRPEDEARLNVLRGQPVGRSIEMLTADERRVCAAEYFMKYACLPPSELTDGLAEAEEAGGPAVPGLEDRLGDIFGMGGDEVRQAAGGAVRKITSELKVVLPADGLDKKVRASVERVIEEAIDERAGIENPLVKPGTIMLSADIDGFAENAAREIAREISSDPGQLSEIEPIISTELKLSLTDAVRPIALLSRAGLADMLEREAKPPSATSESIAHCALLWNEGLTVRANLDALTSAGVDPALVAHIARLITREIVGDSLAYPVEGAEAQAVEHAEAEAQAQAAGADAAGQAGDDQVSASARVRGEDPDHEEVWGGRSIAVYADGEAVYVFRAADSLWEIARDILEHCNPKSRISTGDIWEEVQRMAADSGLDDPDHVEDGSLIVIRPPLSEADISAS